MVGDADGTRVRDPLRVYIVNQTAHWFIVGLTFPVLVLFVLDKGLDLLQAGIVLSGYSLATIVLELPTGGLSDTIGRRKVYIMSLTVMLAGDIILLFAWDFPSTILAAVTLGAARALSSGSIEAWFIDEFKMKHPGGDLQRALAKSGAMIPLGLGAGSLLGGLVPMSFGSLSVDTFSSHYGLNFAFAAFFVIVQIMLTLALVRERHSLGRSGRFSDGVRKTPEMIATSVKYGVRNRVTFLLLLSTLALGFALFSLELLWQPRVIELSSEATGTWMLGVLAAGYFLASSVGSLASPLACRKFKGHYPNVLLLSRIGMGLSLVILAMQGGLLGFSAVYLLVYFIVGMEDSPFSAIFNDQVPSKARSTLISFRSLMLQLGGVAGAIIIGYLADAASIPVAWTLAGAVLLVSAVAFAMLSRMDWRRENKDVGSID
ncbi:MAG: MFS transporter [Methanomassiliicoccales archaeon]|nr:MFS transporter [Methanomassiliicoccales archaeon]